MHIGARLSGWFSSAHSTHYHWTKEWGEGLVPDVPIRVPQAFWWQGPQGGRVLHWLNEHYMLGNVLGVSSNKPFGADKTRYFLETDDYTVDDLYALARQELPLYVDRLQAAGYAHPIMLLSTGGRVLKIIPTAAREVFDVSGAGDTSLAGLVLALTAGASLEQAAHFTNAAAGVVVGKLGTATVTPAELLAYVAHEA